MFVLTRVYCTCNTMTHVLIQIHYLGRVSANEFVDQLKTNLSVEETISILEKLRVAVGTYPINWLHDFAKRNGHTQLLNLMRHWNEVRPDESKLELLIHTNSGCIQDVLLNLYVYRPTHFQYKIWLCKGEIYIK